MTVPEGSLDGQFIDTTSVTTSPVVTWSGAAFIGSSTLVYPSWQASVFDIGMFGPNFVFASSDAFTATPEPGPAILLLGGGFALGLLRRRAVRG